MAIDSTCLLNMHMPLKVLQCTVGYYWWLKLSRDREKILYMNVMHGTFRIHCKKWLAIFPSAAGMSLTKL
jgi:hypothetical protein